MSLGTKLAPSSSYHPQTDGQSEIVNRKVEEMIRAFANFRKSNWDKYLVDFEVACNSPVHSTTLCTSFYINYGIHPKKNPVEAVTNNKESVNELMEATQELTKYVLQRISS